MEGSAVYIREGGGRGFKVVPLVMLFALVAGLRSNRFRDLAHKRVTGERGVRQRASCPVGEAERTLAQTSSQFAMPLALMAWIKRFSYAAHGLKS